MKWYKGNLHAHSFWSDGHGFPDLIADYFKSAGYHFIAFTEHDCHQVGDRWIADSEATETGVSLRRYRMLEQHAARFGNSLLPQRHRAGRTEIRLPELKDYRGLIEEAGKFIILTGEEVTSPWGIGDYDHTNYLNIYGLDRALGGQPLASTSLEGIRSVCALGRSGVVSLNHPNWHYNANATDIAAAADLRLMEIYTAMGTCNNDGDDVHPSVETMWDTVLSARLRDPRGHAVYGLATDDCHAYVRDHHVYSNRSLPGRAWINVRSGALEQDMILEAVSRGDFYCSTGVALRELASDDTGIQIEIEPQHGVRYVTRFVGTTMTGSIGDVLGEDDSLEPKYEFAGDELYVRAVVQSSSPHPIPHRPGEFQRAWTQPVAGHS